MRWTWMALGLLAGCSGGEPNACDQGTPTCEGTLLVRLPDSRTQFTLHVSDALGMQIDQECPIPADDTGGGVFGSYVASCSAGTLTITTNQPFGDSVDVQLEEGLPETYTPTWSRGGDYCGNECDQGTIQL